MARISIDRLAQQTERVIERWNRPVGELRSPVSLSPSRFLRRHALFPNAVTSASWSFADNSVRALVRTRVHASSCKRRDASLG